MNPGRLLPVRSLDGTELASRASDRGNIRVFVSFDLEHDGHFYELLLEQSRAAASGFEVLGNSEFLTDSGRWSDRVRQQIGEADQVIVICGEHTDAS